MKDIVSVYSLVNLDFSKTLLSPQLLSTLMFVIVDRSWLSGWETQAQRWGRTWVPPWTCHFSHGTFQIMSTSNAIVIQTVSITFSVKSMMFTFLGYISCKEISVHSLLFSDPLNLKGQYHMLHPYKSSSLHDHQLYLPNPKTGKKSNEKWNRCRINFAVESNGIVFNSETCLLVGSLVFIYSNISSKQFILKHCWWLHLEEIVKDCWEMSKKSIFHIGIF